MQVFADAPCIHILLLYYSCSLVSEFFFFAKPDRKRERDNMSAAGKNPYDEKLMTSLGGGDLRSEVNTLARSVCVCVGGCLRLKNAFK